MFSIFHTVFDTSGRGPLFNRVHIRKFVNIHVTTGVGLRGRFLGLVSV